MTSLAKRISTAVVALPLLFIIIFFLPQMNHLAFACVAIAACLFGVIEMNDMVGRKGKVSRVTYLSPLLMLFHFIVLYNDLSRTFTYYLFVLLAAMVMIIQIFRGEADGFETSIDIASRSLLVLVYPGLLSTFLIDLLFLEHSTSHILLFLSLVFGSDTFAYFSGMAFGRNNKGVVKVSPNKSVAGFVGGTLIPGFLGLGAFMIWPEKFGSGALGGFVLGFVTAVAGTLGDLLESTIKRSAGVKDSGFIIPGRGGILDSIDSLLVACPFFIMVLKLMEAA